MGKVLVGDLLTGRVQAEIPFVHYKWGRRRNRAGSLSVDITTNDPDVRELNLFNAATGGKSFLAIVEEVEGGEWFPEAGALNEPSYDRDAGTLSLSASGVIDYFATRTVAPSSVLTADVATFLVPDPLDATKTIPNPEFATVLSGWSWGTLIKKVLAQSVAAPGGGLPIVFLADVVGAHEKTYDAIDFKPVNEAIIDFTKRDGGPDFVLDARFQVSRLAIEWLLRTGSDAQPELRSTSVHRWDLTAEQTSTRGLKFDPDASMLGSVSWATGGRSADLALVERASSSFLTLAGYPLREIIDTSHTDVKDRATLREYATENLTRGQGVTNVFSFEVRKDEPPYLGQYDIGDYCDLIIRGDPIIPDSPETGYRHEISAISGDDGDWVKITTVEV